MAALVSGESEPGAPRQRLLVWHISFIKSMAELSRIPVVVTNQGKGLLTDIVVSWIEVIIFSLALSLHAFYSEGEFEDDKLYWDEVAEDDEDDIANETNEDIDSEADEDDTNDVETIFSYDSDV
ncbi:hypothetical protein Droror1_Dr00020169 [Drosera rotundifolia]